jgi:hypothetical protein
MKLANVNCTDFADGFILTVDQALYFKLMDLKWSAPEYRERLVPRMGGLHIAMNFMKCIGDHISGAGLYELWMECELLGLLLLKMF